MEKDSARGGPGSPPKKVRINNPIPVRGPQLGQIDRAVSAALGAPSLPHTSFEASYRSFTPTALRNPPQNAHRRASYSTIEFTRESHYNLDYVADRADLERLQLDPLSRFYARSRPRTLNLPRLLPYELENPQNLAKFLAHIVSHLYIAIKTLDLQGSLSVSARDLALLRELSGFSDIDIALETNLFESSGPEKEVEPDEEGFFQDEIDSGSESLEDEDDEDEDLESDGEESNEHESTVQHKKSPKSAAVVGVRIWTQELLVWLKMKYEMPVKLRMDLAKVYYAICLARGQHLSLRIYVRTFELLTKNIQFLRSQNFKLPWEPLYHELEHHFPSVDSSHERFEKKDHKQLLRLAERASNFFVPSSLPEIFRRLGSHFSMPNTSLALSATALLPLHFANGIDDPEDIRHYIALLFYIWVKLNKSPGVDAHMTTRLGAIAMEHYVNIASGKDIAKPGEIYSPDQLKTIFNMLLNSLSIRKEKYSSSKTKFFHGFASAIIFSIDGDAALERGGVFEQLETLGNALESYIHPSNSGEWSRSISKSILALVYQFQKRLNLENQVYGSLYNVPPQMKLTQRMNDAMIEIFLPRIRLGIQSKKTSVSDDYLAALSLIAQLNPPKVLDYVLLDIYESLEGTLSTHRVVVALRSLEELARYFACTPIFRVHIARLLLLALPGIDSNDLGKTLLTLNVFASFANYVPFHDLSNGEGDPTLAFEFTQQHMEYLQRRIYDDSESGDFPIDEELERNALVSSSSSFKPLIKALNQRIFTLLENIPDPSKSAGLEQAIESSLPKFMYVLLEAVSDDILKAFRDDFFTYAMENSIEGIGDIVAEICGGIIKRDPSTFKSFSLDLTERIKNEVEENGAGSKRTGVDVLPRDQLLLWSLLILNECVGNAGSEVLTCRHELVELSFFLMERIKGPTVMASAYLLNQLLQTTTKIRLKEQRLISPAYEKEYGISEKCWGGFLTDEDRFSKKNLMFDWFLPGEDEISFALDTFTVHISLILEKVLSLMRDKSKTPMTHSLQLQMSDELTTCFLYLSYCLSGISYLFDPSFDEDIPQLGQLLSQSVQQRLYLLKQIRGAGLGKNKEGELRIENLHENLQRIVEDLDSDESINYLMDFDKINDFMMLDKEQTLDGDGDEPEINHPVPFEERSGVKSQSTSPAPPDESARATPMIEGMNMSSINPSLTFRERKMYTSKYYFGDDIETRRANPSYLKLHKGRILIGRALHVIGKFLNQNFTDNTLLFKHYLFAVNIWFSDLGRERKLDSSEAHVSYRYFKTLQTVNKVKKPFTRMALGSRLESYHHLRVALHATSRTQTDLDKVLLEDVIKLAVSTYSSIAKPAQFTLVDAMGRLNGSYNVLVRSVFKHLESALQKQDHKKIESALRVFLIKRIKNRIQNDYYNLQKYVQVLLTSLEVDNLEVNAVAQKLYQGIHEGISLPSSVCLIDLKQIDFIRPPDQFIDLEIKAVILAKERKREAYFERLKRLENFLLKCERESTHWKVSSLNLHLLVDLQSDLEMEVNLEALQILWERSSSDHPITSRLALRGITKIVTKLNVMSQLEHKLANGYDVNFIPRDFKVVSTMPENGSSYSLKWKSEMQERSSPSFFIDHKANSGWLFWGESLIVVDNHSDQALDLTAKEDLSLRALGAKMTKEWFADIVNLWISDNEANFAFQGSDVFVTTTITQLIAGGYTTDFSFDDLMDLVESIYISDEKSSHIVTCELIAGILVCSKSLSQTLSEKRDARISLLLRRILDEDLSPDTRGIWNIFSWWIPAHIDCRRFPKINDLIVRFRVHPESDSAIREATRLSYIRAYIAAVTWSFGTPSELFEASLETVSNRYRAIRDQVGSILAVLSFCYFADSLSSSEEFLVLTNTKGPEYLLERLKANEMFERIPEVFKEVEQLKAQVTGETPQNILNSPYIASATTVLTWLGQVLNTSVAILYQDFVDTHILPFLLELINMKEVCQLGDIDPITVFKHASQIHYLPHMLERIVAKLELYAKEDLNALQCFIVGEFTETFYFKNLYELTAPQRIRIINVTSSLLHHKNVEVREAEASTFAGLIHLSPPQEVTEIVKKCCAEYEKKLDEVRRKYRKSGYKQMTAEETAAIHGACLGLGALIHAYLFQSPPPSWVPRALSILANKASGIPGVVGKTSRDTLGRFKKTRQDTWHVDSKVFSEDQIQDLEGVLWKSYYI